MPRSISSVRLAQADRRAARYAGLVNAVLRRVAQKPRRDRCAEPATRDTPDWLLARWTQDLRRRDRARHRRSPTATSRRSTSPSKHDAERWAERLRGRVLPTGTRAHAGARRDRRCCPASPKAPGGCRTPPPRCRRGCSATCAGLRVADLCAAPGGKTAQLALAGARVTAVDRSPARLARLRENLARLGARRRDASPPTCWNGRREPVRRRAARCALLVDRHHPPPSRRALAQGRGRHRAAHRACSSGCSTAPSSCSSPAARWSIASARSSRRKARRRSPRCWRANRGVAPRAARRPQKSFGHAEFITADGDLRTLPLHLPDPDPRWGGLDGFFAARLARI